MKILICSLTYPLPNGVTISVNTSADGFLERGHQVRIVSPDYGGEKFRPEHFPAPSSFWGRKLLKLFDKKERMFGARASFYIKKIEKEFLPDVYWLHTLSWAPNAFEKHICKSKKPKVLTYHTLVEEYARLYAGKLGAGIMRRRSKAVANKMDAIITPSQVIKKKLREYGVSKPIFPIFTGIDVPEKSFTREEFSERFNIPKNAKILLFVGRVSKEKNIGLLFRVVKELKKREFNAVLVIVGPGDVQEAEKEITRMKIEERVVFTGPLSKEDAQKTYGASEAFVFASQTETQGLVIGEAMAAGIPVVALVSQIQEEVYPKDVAVVVKKESDFTQALIDILESHQKRAEMIERAKAFVIKNFSKDAMISKQVKLFEDLLKKKTEA